MPNRHHPVTDAPLPLIIPQNKESQMVKRVEYGILDERGDLLMLPGQDSYLRTTVKDLDYLLRVFGEDTKCVKITIEDVTSDQTQTAQSVDTPPSQVPAQSDVPSPTSP
jgi:hypothetical protein